MGMKIQSLSIVVPNKECINKCPFCVSRMVNSNTYPNLMDINNEFYDHNVREYLKCMRYVADNGCHTAMLTGTSEPQQNKQFLATFALLHAQIGNPFHNIEMQTTGVLLNANYLRFLRNFVGVRTMAISVNSIHDEVNMSMLGPSSSKVGFTLKELCKTIKDYNFNLRLCCNLTGKFDEEHNHFASVFKYFKEELHADQITFREMYASDENTVQGEWLEKHPYSLEDKGNLINFLKEYPQIGETMYGAPIRDVRGMSVVYDDDCMGKNPKKDAVKYMILRPNCKLYTSWDTPASLVF